MAKHDDKPHGYDRHDDKEKHGKAEPEPEPEQTPEEQARDQELSDLGAYHSKVMTDLQGKQNAIETQIAHLEESKAALAKEAAGYEKAFREKEAEIHAKYPTAAPKHK